MGAGRRHICSPAALLALSLPTVSQKPVQPRGEACPCKRSNRVSELTLNGVCVFLLQITGGSSGIGKAVAKEALLRGAEVVTILARNEVRT